MALIYRPMAKLVLEQSREVKESMIVFEGAMIQ